MDELKVILINHFGIPKPELRRVEGYANANFIVDTGNGNRFILKKYREEPGLMEELIAESNTLESLSGKFTGRVPRPLKTLDGNYVLSLPGTENTLYRLLGWVKGTFLHQSTHTPALFRSLGTLLGGIDCHLLDRYDPVTAGRRIDWDLQRLSSLRNRLSLIKDRQLRKLVHHYLLQFREEVDPLYPVLRHSVIHNDANDWNILVTDGQVSGIIDFGDMVYAPLIQDLAVCLTYALFDKEDPLQWAGHLIKAYDKALPLEPQEVDLLYYLVAGRLCMSILNAAQGQSDDPYNEYRGVSQDQARRLLLQWVTINPVHASAAFRRSCGMEEPAVEPVDSCLARRSLHISKAQSVSYTNPIHMHKAAFQYMYDAYGNAFLDAYNNIPHVGHQHPRVVEAGQRQMARLNTNTRYLYGHLSEYAERLLARFPQPLNKVFFVNSGSAASDLAIRMAQTHTGNRSVMVLEHGYHGNTRLGIDISHYKFGGKGGRGQAEYVIKVPIPDTYRGRHRADDGSAGKAYAQEAMDLLRDAGMPVAAFIAEPIVGCAGQVPLAKGYLKHIYPFIRQAGGVCISDEVQTGFGRVGSAFWGFEMQEVVPDIVVLGKPMGNGHPLAAVVTTDAIAASFDNGMEFFSSFGGNPVSCAIGMAVLEVIEEEGLQKHAQRTGAYFMKLLKELMAEFECVGDVRGAGLFLGVELVTDRNSKNHNPELASRVKNELRNNNILVSTDGPRDNIIKMKPPLCFDNRNADRVVEEMFRIFKLIL